MQTRGRIDDKQISNVDFRERRMGERRDAAKRGRERERCEIFAQKSDEKLMLRRRK